MPCWGGTHRTDAFEALLEPHADGLLGDLLFNGVLQLFPGQQLLQLERLANVHGAVGQHAANTVNGRHKDTQNTLFKQAYR